MSVHFHCQRRPGACCTTPHPPPSSIGPEPLVEVALERFAEGPASHACELKNGQQGPLESMVKAGVNLREVSLC